jgi:hypothetical protein
LVLSNQIRLSDISLLNINGCTTKTLLYISSRLKEWPTQHQTS